jgi:hypothetical protein
MEYSPSGLSFIRFNVVGVKNVFHVPILSSKLECFYLARTQDIDVLFYGSPIERRNRVIDELHSRKVNAVYLFGVKTPTNEGP